MTEIIIPYNPRPVQQEIHARIEADRWSVVVAHRRMGKTVLMINHLIKSSVKNKLQRPHYGYIAPLYSQAKQIAWEYLKFYTSVIPGVKRNESELWVELPHNHARIKLYGADNPDSLRGLYFDGVVLDEYADMKPSVWQEVVRPALTDRHGWGCFIGTPKGLNQFYELYRMALEDPSWYAGIFPASKTGILSQEELDAARASGISDAAYRQEFECDFTASSDDIFIPLSVVEPAIDRQYDRSVYYGAPVILGIDVARFGDDSTEVFLRQGLISKHLRSVKDADLMTLAGLITQDINTYSPSAVFVDEVGIGAGVVDRLKQLGFKKIIGVNAGSKPLKSGAYRNKRAEMWGAMRNWLLDGGAIPKDSLLAAQLSTPMYSFDEANRVKLEKKEDIKKRGLKSPDKADALALTFAYPVSTVITDPITQRPYNNAPQVAQTKYDLFKRRAA